MNTVIFLATFALLANTVSGQAQGRPGIGQTGRSGALLDVLTQVSNRPPVSMLVLDTNETAWESLSTSLLRQYPAVALNLNLIGLNVGRGAGLELSRREGWSEGSPRWCLISTDGRILFNSQQSPTPELIMEAYVSAGLRSRLDILRHFLSFHPEHAEARLALLGELRAIAEARTRSEIGAGEPTSRAGTTNTVQEITELDSEIDRNIWGDYVVEAENVFRAGLWKQDTRLFWSGGHGSGNMGMGQSVRLFRGGGNPLVSDLAQHSPQLKRLYQSWLPDIEFALNTRPSSSHLWNFWLVVQHAAGAGRDMGALTAALVLPPGTGAENVPPSFVRSRWVQDCISRGEWRMAEGVAREAWEDLLFRIATAKETGQRPQTAYVGRSNSLPNAGTWNAIAEPYLHLLLLGQKTGLADEVLRQWLAHGGWTGAIRRAASLAARLGYVEVEDRWKLLVNSY